MKTSNLLLISGLALMLTGCGYTIISEKEIERIRTKVVTKVDTQDVHIPVACKIPPIPCSFEGEGIIPTFKLMECISTQKKVLELCSETNKEELPKNEELLF